MIDNSLEAIDAMIVLCSLALVVAIIYFFNQLEKEKKKPMKTNSIQQNSSTEIVRCANCGSTKKVWYHGLCEECYSKVYQKEQIKQQENVSNQTIPHRVIAKYYCPNCKNEISDSWHFCNYCGCNLDQIQNDTSVSTYYDNDTLSMDWFKSYLSVMKFFIILYSVSILSTLINNAISYNSSLTIVLSLLDAMYIWFQIKVYISLKTQMPSSVQNLLIILIINWFTRPLVASAYSEDVTYGVYLWLYAIWYIPNIIYFYKRIDVFKN